ncbi:ABC transporter ATP-binding protein [Aquariibacter albus]|uniref:ABC transporter ATP-binding protein n=1 Tax=Aquariibacter albus TaxID=2759899 RepID=A0A839HTQ4_9BURK|nr:ABC transporter ATP-binding protein [Aquariibacter albus]MBB1162869.1 ABC transporter ATP-binding protein [Aquariibacter albus]
MSLPLAWSPAVPRGERSDAVARRAAVEPVLALQGIGLRFGGLQVLEGVDLAVQPGEIHALIGPNGAGKSSLLNIISGLYRPSAGRVQLGGQRFRRVPTARLARLGVARSFQNLALFPGLDLRANIALGRVAAERAGLFAQWLGLARARREAAEARQLTEALIQQLGLAEVADRPVATLPYGLKKRVELARALIARPRLLLLDEPLAGVPAEEKPALAALIREARAREGFGVLLIEHDLAWVLALADRLTVLDRGRVIASGAPEAVRQDPAVVAAYLGGGPA